MSKSRGEGGVIPGLLGPWSLQDLVGWSDDVTLDYNAEANYYGAASSNHAESMSPYFPTLQALVPLGRLRADLRSWDQEGHESHGTAGEMIEAMGYNCDTYDHCYVDNKNKTCPTNFGGFNGIEIPSAIGAFEELHCSHGSSMRSTAAMVAQPFIDYVDYTHNMTFMKTQAYPYVKEASYLKLDSEDQKYGPIWLCSGAMQWEAIWRISLPKGRYTIDLAYMQLGF